jgi:hypothetical protein
MSSSSRITFSTEKYVGQNEPAQTNSGQWVSATAHYTKKTPLIGPSTYTKRTLISTNEGVEHRFGKIKKADVPDAVHEAYKQHR